MGQICPPSDLHFLGKFVQPLISPQKYIYNNSKLEYQITILYPKKLKEIKGFGILTENLYFPWQSTTSIKNS